MVPFASMTKILSDDKRKQVLALGQLGWTLRRIEQATGVRRETASMAPRSQRVEVQAAGAVAPVAVGTGPAAASPPLLEFERHRGPVGRPQILN